MTAIIKESFRTFAVKKVRESFFPTATANALYLGIGRPYVWGESDVPPNSAAMSKSLDGDLQDWEDLMFLKRLGSSVVSHSIKKRMWSQNKKYDPYRSDWNNTNQLTSVNGTQPSTLSESDYYVVTALDDIYICIKQAKTFSAGSGIIGVTTQSPDNGTPLVGAPSATGLIQTSDGYIWKYIGSTSAADVIAFSTDEFHPIRNVDINLAQPSGDYARQWQSQKDSRNYRGGIYNIIVNTEGTGYNGGLAGTKIVLDAKNGTTGENGTGEEVIKVEGDGTGLVFKVVYTSGGKIADITVLNPGAGYTYAKITPLGTGNSAILVPIFTPHTGLGVNPVEDMQAFNMSIYCELDSNEGVGDFTIDNEFRKICLIANPMVYGSYVVPYTDPYATLTWNLALDGPPTVPEDAELTMTLGGTVVLANLVDVKTGPDLIRVMRTRSALATPDIDYDSDILPGMNITYESNSVANVTTVTTPDVQAGSGEVLYAEYRYPLRRALNQKEQIRLVVEF